jgi:hypothetical protein
MGRAEDLFLRIKHGGADEIDRMIREQVVEELFLDYKRAATVAPFKPLALSDRKNLAKAISGFANSEGGIIVWGVDCRLTPPYGDVPTAPIPISNPTAFKSLLEGAITGLTLPAHSGVENIALQISSQSAGFVVTHIPIGMHVPYRTLGDKEEYYIRAGSNFAPTPHAVLAGLFGRAPQPKLNIKVDLQRADGAFTPQVCNMFFDIELFNSGRGLAEGLFLTAELTLPKGSRFYFSMEMPHAWNSWQGEHDFTMISKTFPPLPPGPGVKILTLRLEIPFPGRFRCFDLRLAKWTGHGPHHLSSKHDSSARR